MLVPPADELLSWSCWFVLGKLLSTYRIYLLCLSNSFDFFLVLIKCPRRWICILSIIQSISSWGPRRAFFFLVTCRMIACTGRAFILVFIHIHCIYSLLFPVYIGLSVPRSPPERTLWTKQHLSHLYWYHSFYFLMPSSMSKHLPMPNLILFQFKGESCPCLGFF